MSVIPLPSTRPDDWIKQFDPSKRILTGKAYLTAKRVMDVAIIVFSLPAWIPLMAIVALMLFIGSPGEPVIFVQQRTGKGGKRFKMYKFRTMVVNAEELKKELATLNDSGDLAGPLKLIDDPRVTPIGHFLRKTSLDELPQIINVLLGDMSLVGPRPTSWSPESYKLWHTERLDVLPGITGLWQIFGRGSQDFDEWLRWDIRYLERQCLLLDILILVRTFTAVFTHRGAR
jgi:lipopolysaccharide/colanic/teichoic acid biosynthesis glycosyltransferase